MSSIVFSLPDIFNSYKAWVIRNPQNLSDYELTAKWISYFIAGRINNSHVVSELVYCLSNLLVFLNDRILNEAKNIYVPTSGDTIKLWLTIIEYSEVFLELSAKKIWGTTGKWLVIVAIQAFKCISRLLLVYKHSEGVIQNPPIPVINRKNINKPKQNSNEIVQFDRATFTLKRSGRLVRKVETSPPIAARNWKPLQLQLGDEETTVNNVLHGRKLFAETMYISKPIAHLVLMACFGEKNWKPWIFSLAMDATSLQLYRSCKKTKINSLTHEQRLQMSRRMVCLLLYLIRSPFYEKYSRDKIRSFLMSCSKHIPLIGMVCNPLMEYLPFWQSSYFYMWST